MHFPNRTPESGGLRDQQMNERFIDTHVTGSRKPTAVLPSARHAINKPRSRAPSLWEAWKTRRCPPGPAAHPTMCHCSLRAACESRGESVFALPAGPSYLISAAATPAQVYSPFYRRERANRGPGPGRPGRLAAAPPGSWGPWHRCRGG